MSQTPWVESRSIFPSSSLDSLVPTEFWKEVASLFPREPERPKGGRPRLSDRACLAGIVYILKNDLAWNLLPAWLGCGNGVTCWRRLREWMEAGIWDELRRRLLDVPGGLHELDVARVDRIQERSSRHPDRRGG